MSLRHSLSNRKMLIGFTYIFTIRKQEFSGIYRDRVTVTQSLGLLNGTTTWDCWLDIMEPSFPRPHQYNEGSLASDPDPPSHPTMHSEPTTSEASFQEILPYTLSREKAKGRVVAVAKLRDFVESKSDAKWHRKVCCWQYMREAVVEHKMSENAQSSLTMSWPVLFCFIDLAGKF